MSKKSQNNTQSMLTCYGALTDAIRWEWSGQRMDYNYDFYSGLTPYVKQRAKRS